MSGDEEEDESDSESGPEDELQLENYYVLVQCKWEDVERRVWFKIAYSIYPKLLKILILTGTIFSKNMPNR